MSGSQIIAEIWVEDGVEHMLIYVYDEVGAPIGLKYRTNEYDYDVFDSFLFEKNLQGDVVGIYDVNGAKIGRYVYDAWGNHTVTVFTSNTLAKKIVNDYNPFRYRGYYYDVETGWYYLQSRYYDPEWCRFITMDEIAVIIATPTGLTDKNLYAYCDNNPITRIDEDGEFWLLTTAVKFVGGLVTRYVEDVVENVIDGKSGRDIFVPHSTMGEYFASGVTAMIPGGGFGKIFAENVVSEGICLFERSIRDPENADLVESINTVVTGTFGGIVLDKASTYIGDFFDAKKPKNLLYAQDHIQDRKIVRKMKHKAYSMEALKIFSNFSLGVMVSVVG